MSNYEILKAIHMIQKMKYSNRNTNKFSLSSEIKTIEKFSESDNFKLPLKVCGRLITAGDYKDKELGVIRLSEDKLRESLSGWEGIEIYKHHGCFEGLFTHGEIPADSIVGKITSVRWAKDNEKGAIDWFGEIVDRDIAYKIIKGLIKHVSVGFTSDNIMCEDGVYEKENIIPMELSLIIKNPRDKNASVLPFEVEYIG